MEIKILGTGCTKCQLLEENAREAVQNLNLDAKFEKVTDLNEIMSYGVMSTPSIVVDGKVVSMGKLLGVKQIEELLK